MIEGSLKHRILSPLILALSLTAWVVGCPHADTSRPGEGVASLTSETPFLIDHGGGVLILHGVNVMSASKGTPDHNPPLDQGDAEDFGRNLRQDRV